MFQALVLAAVATSGLFFVSLGVAAFVSPTHVRRFLLGFASSPAKHYAELGLRLLVGSAFLLAAPKMVATTAFTVFGCVLLVTTAALLFLPWRWHHHFASRSVPKALQFLPLLGFASAALGGAVLWVVVSSVAT